VPLQQKSAFIAAQGKESALSAISLSQFLNAKKAKLKQSNSIFSQGAINKGHRSVLFLPYLSFLFPR